MFLMPLAPSFLRLFASQVVGFVPTGWMYEMKRKAFPVREKGSCFIHLVPYSEHSSYSELRDYVRFLRPHKVLMHHSGLLPLPYPAG